MSMGEVSTLRITSDFAYKDAGAGDGAIPPNADLAFKVELLGINGNKVKLEVKELSAEEEKERLDSFLPPELLGNATSKTKTYKNDQHNSGCTKKGKKKKGKGKSKKAEGP